MSQSVVLQARRPSETFESRRNTLPTSGFQELASSWREAGQNKGGKAHSSVREPFPFVLVKSLERCEDPQSHDSRDEAPTPAPGIKDQRTSLWFLVAIPRASSPLPFLCGHGSISALFGAEAAAKVSSHAGNSISSPF
ncbi:Hypothetical predicted protein [Podarcis lilfordi]|uniref:Uncharacterized protein n=1 Tax=Podarcis lilfordi TaxID=74358 RepID=A0AA35PI67_9SAUR|nr:Hypothetical predicted protein [Podarcis lilfordi]